jgi:hypothetical protein
MQSLFTGNGGRSFNHFARAEVAPASFGTLFEEPQGGVDREGMRRHFQHGKVVERVAEDGISPGNSDAPESGGFGGSGGNVDEFAGDDSVCDSDLRSEHSIVGDAEFANTFRDDPLIGGADGPEFDSLVAQHGDERGYFGEDVRPNMFGKVTCGSGAEFLFMQAGVHLHHLSADLEFADVSGDVGAVAGVHPVAGGAGDESLVHGPDHEAVAGVAAPEGTVAVEDCDFGGRFQDEMFELLSGPASDFELC